MKKNLGIYSVGTYLPPVVRKNDWWPQDIVEQWKARQAKSLTRAQQEPEDPPTEGMRITLEAMAQFKHDPFEGSVERHVMPEGMRSSDMEVAAARDALQRANVDASEIDLLLVDSVTPNYIHVPNACVVHRDLGLRSGILSMSTEAVCGSFLQQLVMAEGLLAAGRIRHALIVQSCNFTAFMRQEDPWSAWFGDAATAAVLGPVDEGKGVLGHAHTTDGSVYGSIVTGVPGKRWLDEGRVIGYLEDAGKARLQFLKIAEMGVELVESALREAKLTKADLTFWACHQASAWLPRAVQARLGIGHARRVDTFPWAASVSGCNVPLVLATAEREGLLGAGDVVAMYSGAAGMTASSIVARWGR